MDRFARACFVLESAVWKRVNAVRANKSTVLLKQQRRI
jgi:hypothetical protein